MSTYRHRPDPAVDLLAAALDAAARGWPVFPLRPGTKRPALHGTDHCPRTGPCTDGHAGWEQRATTDPDRIRRAWSTGPFNVGLATGPAGLVVVDVDTADPDDQPPEPWAALGIRDGAEVLTALADQTRQLIPATRVIATPSGGEHLYFLAPTGDGAPVLRNTAGGLGRGLGWKIDTRAHGGYVVAAGSLTPTGAYRVIADRDPVPLPGWLVDRLRPPALPPPPSGSIRTAAGRTSRYLHAALTAETDRVRDAPARQRNACLYVAAIALGQLVAGGSLAEHHARGVLLDAAAGHIAIDAYSARQAEQTITSGLRAGAKRPRRIADDKIGNVA
jgi:bifunctional DNA primase/polymerase-like protein